jgi:thymidylate synthase
MDTKVIYIEDGVNGYVDLVNWVFTHGEEVAPRGQKTREIEDATVFIKDVYNTLPLGISRGTVPGIGAVEACQLIAGVSYPDTVIAVGPQFKNFTEDNGLFHGAYGLRTAGQYSAVIERLKNDPSTRQAVVTIWNPEFDLQPHKRDYPCTILHQFRIRNNKLNMSVYMRSNDVWLGAAYDFFQFTRVQIAIASVLGIEPGTYGHHVGSLHIYEQHYEAADSLRYTDSAAFEKIPPITGSTWLQVETKARVALDAVYDEYLRDHLTADQQWYVNAMVSAVEKNLIKEKK